MLAFLIIGCVGVVLLLISLVIGDHLDGAFDALGSDVISGTALAGFLGALGFVGALVVDGTGSTGVAIISGLIAGVLVGLGVGWVSNRLRTGGDEANLNTASLVGRTATVLNPIPAGGYGDISIVAAGHITRLNARADEPVLSGSAVVITGILSPTAVLVEPLPR